MDRRILVADDDPDVRRNITLMVKHWGYQVTAVANGEEAWAILSGDDPPRMAILDWMMPGLDGPEVCRRVRAKGAGGGPYTYILLLTARTQKADVVSGLEAGADDFLSKPFFAKELQARLEAGTRGRVPKDAPARAGAVDPNARLDGMVIGGRYRLVRGVGFGGMGVVWEGEHVVLGTKVAVKLLPPASKLSPAALERFETEAKAVAQLASPHVAKALDFGVTDHGWPYFVMEYLDGLSLRAAVEKNGPLPQEEVGQLMAECEHALTDAHVRGIVHRDVKPDNLMLARTFSASSNSRWTAKVIDFGIAKLRTRSASSPDLAVADAPAGTPAFMSPEQLLHGATDASVDLWGLACCAFFALTGQGPFDAESLGDIIVKVCSDQPRPLISRLNPKMPKALDTWFAKATAKEPDDRFPTMAAQGVALRQALKGMR